MAGYNKKNKRTGSYSKNAIKNKNKIIGILVILMIVLVVGIAIAWQMGYLAPIGIGDDTTTTTSTSTITLISYTDGEDVSDFVEVTIWVPEEDADFDELEEIYILTNFEAEESSKDADDIAIDLSDYTYIWVEIDPDAESVFSNQFYLIYGGYNNDYTFYVYHLTSDVNFNIFARDTLNEITVADYQTDSNLTLIFDCPHYTASDIHANTDDWDMDDEDWDDATASEKAEYYDEKNWRSQAVLYDPQVDTENDPDSNLEEITEAMAFKFDFNDSISTVDGNDNQINITLADDDAPVEIVISGDLIYLIYYETVDFEDGAQELIFEIEFGSAITLSDVDSGRIVLPKGDDSLGTFTKYSDIAA